MKNVLTCLQQPAWQGAIEQRVAKPTLTQLSNFLTQQLSAGATIYPAQENWFRALNTLAPEQVKVVILGQDPYHGPEQAQGLSFSVPNGMKCPPSLRNIFKELAADLQINNEATDLSPWLEQGVLLLNAVLTVEANKAGSHAKQGWEAITDAVIQSLSDQEKPVVFMLWGAYAEKKRSLIDTAKHCVLSAAHPSPLSAHRGWFGSKHFSQANEFLAAHQQSPIRWLTSEQAQQALF